MVYLKVKVKVKVKVIVTMIFRNKINYLKVYVF